MSIVLDGDNLTSTGVPNTRTAQASTSGTSIDFTSIPAGVKRITVMLAGVSTSGTSFRQVQIGSGSVTTSGYTCVTSTCANAGTPAMASYTSGFLLDNYAPYYPATALVDGHLVLTLLTGNTWVASGISSNSAGSTQSYTSGKIALGGTLDRVRITTVNGTDTFDAGSINILYE
jgi:hypothetical protein